MGIPGLIFLLITHYLTGRGFLHLFNLQLKPIATAMLSMICGVIIASMYPMLMQLCFIPITYTNVGICIILFTILLNITSFKKYKLPSFKLSKINIQVYEIPFLLLFALFMFISAWRCFYFPTFARDMLSGPEAVAEYTVREHTMINSIFSLNLESTNNHLKPPFVTDLQIIYKLFVYPFGEVWLSIIVIPFLIWIYTLLREKLHPIVACLAMLFFITMPDPFAYTYIVLFDYCNMICFFAGFYFLAQYFENKQYNFFLFSIAMFALATYIRPETLILLGMTGPLVLYFFLKEKVPLSKIAIRAALFAIIPFIFYYIWIGVFIKYYMPLHFDVGHQIEPGKTPFWGRLTDMTKLLIFGIADNPGQKNINLRLYGYFMYFWMFIFAIDLVFFRKKFNREALIMLYGIAVVYIGMPLLGYLIPLVDLMNTTKRGLYKLFPLMLIYMRNSGVLTMISNGINNWEYKNVLPKSTPKPQPVTPVNTKTKKGK